MRKLVLVIGLFLMLFIVSCQGEVGTITGSSERCREEQVPYETTEEYQEEEIYYDSIPYEDEECNEIEVPYTATEEYEKTLFSYEDQIIEPYNRLYVTVPLKEDMTITVKFKADDTLHLWAFDDEEFEKIQEGDESENWYIKQTEVSDAQESFKVPTDDNYVIYLKSTHIVQDVSVYEFTATAAWEEQVTKYETQEYCTTVTKYKEVEKTRTVTKTKPVVEYKTQTVCE